ncbi:hypothetical protein SELMODRAFT_402710 [Selaginella moellendorffii]|uniref:MACPF domain-containing protein n=1 Tax=Selaginella moellendorffii TaxID=88036 RepID=D8QMT4_SELML|nr:hypothetical protein SELMODRAFT_402710 [Selaginella moellendorffii]
MASENDSSLTNESVLATASGGRALRGFKVSGKEPGPVLSTHVLQVPSNIAIRGPVDPQKTETLKFSSIEDYNTFQEKLGTQGWTLATKVGVSLGKLTMKLQGDYSEEEKEKHKKEMHKKVRTVIVTESLYVPMKCFQIPQLQMTLTDEAKADARRVTGATEATSFLEKYSSHVYAGLYHVGGVLFREVNVTSSHETNACLLMRRGLRKLEISAEASYSSPFFDGKAEGKFSQISDTESYEFANSSLQFETSKVTVRVWGATSVEAKDEFLKKLDADHAAWAIIDKDIDQLKDLRKLGATLDASMRKCQAFLVWKPSPERERCMAKFLSSTSPTVKSCQKQKFDLITPTATSKPGGGSRRAFAHPRWLPFPIAKELVDDAINGRRLRHVLLFGGPELWPRETTPERIQ